MVEYSKLVFIPIFHQNLASLLAMKIIEPIFEELLVDCMSGCYDCGKLWVFLQSCSGEKWIHRLGYLSFCEKFHKAMEFAGKTCHCHLSIDADKLSKECSTVLKGVLVPLSWLIYSALSMN